MTEDESERRYEMDESQAGFAPKMGRRVSQVELALEALRGELMVVHTHLAALQSETGGLRAEFKALMKGLAEHVNAITRDLDAERGRRAAEVEMRAREEKRLEHWSAWGRTLLPFAIGVGITALAFFVDQRAP